MGRDTHNKSNSMLSTSDIWTLLRTLSLSLIILARGGGYSMNQIEGNLITNIIQVLKSVMAVCVGCYTGN